MFGILFTVAVFVALYLVVRKYDLTFTARLTLGALSAFILGFVNEGFFVGLVTAALVAAVVFLLNSKKSAA